MHIQPFRAYDLIDHVPFWQTEQGFDTLDIHEQGSCFLVTCFPEYSRNPALVNNRSKSLVIKLKL